MLILRSLGFTEPVRRSSSTSRNLLNPPSSAEFYGRRASSETSQDISQEKTYSSAKNFIPLFGKTKMVQASKKAFLQVRIVLKYYLFLCNFEVYISSCFQTGNMR